MVRIDNVAATFATQNLLSNGGLFFGKILTLYRKKVKFHDIITIIILL